MSEREAILQQIHARIRGYAASKVDEERAQDLAQEVMVVLLEKYTDLDDPEDLLPVAIQTLKFKLWGDNRRRWRRKEDQQVPVEDLALHYDGPSPEQRTIRQEYRDALRKAVGQLRRPCQELLTMQLEGMSPKEIIQRLGEPDGTVYARINRCRKALEKEMRQILRTDGE